MNNGLVFLVNTVFDLYLFVLTIRLILCWVHADFFNPAAQLIIKLTQRIILPLRKIIPNKSGIEFSTLTVMFVLEILKFLLITLMASKFPHVMGLLILSFADIVKLILNTFFYAIFLQAILTWIQQGYSPLFIILQKMTDPVLSPFQRLIPPISGFDLSPIAALIFLQFVIIVAVSPLMSIGVSLL